MQFSWRATGPVDRPLAVFVHPLDAQGQIVAQGDRPPFGGRWPTTVWQAGESLQDTYEIALPEDLPAGQYGLRFGFYDATGRLSLAGSQADNWTLADAVGIEARP